jgi:hypothetical protein
MFFHKMFLETQIVLRCAPMCEFFTADRPFLFALIIDRNVIFMGHYSIPEKQLETSLDYVVDIDKVLEEKFV